MKTSPHPPNLIALTRGQRLRYASAIVAMALGIATIFLVPQISQKVIDGFVEGAEGVRFVAPELLVRLGAPFGLSAEASSGRAFLLFAGLLVIAITALAGALQYLRGRWAAQASEGIMRDLRNALYDHFARLPMGFFDRSNQGDLVQRATSDVETLRVFLSAQVVEISRAILLLAFVTPVLFVMNAKLAWITLALMPVVVVYSMLFFRSITQGFQAVDEAEGELTTVLQENLTGIRVVRSFGRSAFEEAKFGRANSVHRDKTWDLMRLLSTYWSLSDMICFAQSGLVLFFGARFTMRGEMSIGTWVAFLEYSAMVIWPVRQMGRTLVDASKAGVAMKRVNEILGEPIEEPHDALERSDVALSGELVIEGLTFAFPGGDTVLEELDVHVPKGSTLALVGPPGAGKSVLFELLLRLHDYTEGSIRLDGHELKELPRALARRDMAVVMQSPFLYARTIQENLRFALSGGELSEERMFAATTAAAIHGSIEGFDHGYDTLLGERGVTLSGGQKQRVAIARALLRDAPFLILDDALSAVDLGTEARILDALRERAGKQTTLLASHRLSTVRHADQILVLAGGRVVERGTHDELVARDGRYAHLWKLQTDFEHELEPITASTQEPRHADQD